MISFKDFLINENIDRANNNYKKGFTWNGKEYGSVLELSRDIDTSLETIYNWLRSGYRSDEDVKKGRGKAGPPKKSVTWNGKEYDSVNSLANDLNVSTSTIRNWLNAGFRSTEDVKRAGKGQGGRHRKSITWNGKEYGSVRELSSELDVAPETIYRWLKSGYKTAEDASKGRGKAGPPKKSITWNGKEYGSVRELSNDLNVSIPTTYTWLRRGYRSDKDIKSRAGRKSITWNGKEYESIDKLSNDLNVSRETVYRWLKAGYRSTEDVRNGRKSIYPKT